MKAKARADVAPVSRFEGMAGIASGWIVNPRIVLACLLGVYAVVCGLAQLPDWLHEGQGPIAVVGLVAAGAAFALLVARSIRPWIAQAVLAATAVLTAALILAAAGGPDSAAFAHLSVFVTAYAAMFFDRRAFLGHLLWSLLICGAALTVTDLGNRENGYFVIILAIAMSAIGVVLARLVRTVWYTAIHDPLTGLLNEPGLRAAAAVDVRIGSAHAVDGLILIDIDRFSRINQALGRDGGDDLIRQAGMRLSTCWPSARIARINADTFAVLTSGSDNDLDGVAGILLSGLTHLNGTYRVVNTDVDISVTAGVVANDRCKAVPVAQLLRRAATALSVAKARGTPSHQWTETLDTGLVEDLQLQAELRTALSRGDLDLWYQPKVSRTDHHLTGVEALIRWRHPDRGLLGPGAFLPAAENSPLIHELTAYVLERAVAQAAGWHRADTPLTIAVNLSARNLTDTTLPARVAEILHRHALPAHLLLLEITETAVVAQPEAAIGLLTALRAQGIGISIDDFGTGHTSLALIAELPLDEIKLDRRFIKRIHRPSDAAIVATVADLAHRLGLRVVAEGVEDATTSRQLDALGFDQQQGYHHGRPMPPGHLVVTVSQGAASGRM